MIHQWLGKFLRLHVVVRIFLLASFIMIIFGYIIHLIEPNNFPTVFDGIWWAVVTAATIGYGDYVPETFAGRITGIILMLVGIAIVSSYFVSLATVAVTMQAAYIEGKLFFKGNQHMIIIGWNERSRELISSISKKNPSKKVVLIDETLEAMPTEHKNIHFIKGRASLDYILLKANIHEAQCVVITADQNKNELDADMNTIITLLAIKGTHPTIRCVAEILTSEQVDNARRAGADEIIQSNILTSSLILNSLESHSTMASILNLIRDSDTHHLLICEPVEGIVGKPFYEACNLFFNRNTMLVGIKRGEKTHVNPPQDFVIQKDDLALVITK
ncbi:potassium channel protein [Rhodococcus qingshengii]|nr:potassium channel protein [Rhodococcus qingshengii]